MRALIDETSPDGDLGWLWAAAHAELGDVLSRQRPNDEQAAEEVISSYEAALRVYSQDFCPWEYARIQNNLGSAYSDRHAGSREQNTEQAVAACSAALSVRARHADPYGWARTQNNLGNAYMARLRGDRSDNLSLAIAAFQSALEVHDVSRYPSDYAMEHVNLGLAYQAHASFGSGPERARNLDLAMVSFLQALLVRTPDANIYRYAGLVNNLAAAFKARLELAPQRVHREVVRSLGPVVGKLTERELVLGAAVPLPDTTGAEVTGDEQAANPETTETGGDACWLPDTALFREYFEDLGRLFATANRETQKAHVADTSVQSLSVSEPSGRDPEGVKSAYASLQPQASLVLWLVCRARPEDRVLPVIQAVWSAVWGAVYGVAEAPPLAGALDELAKSGLVDDSGGQLGVDPLVVTSIMEAIPDDTGIVIDRKLAEYWLGSLEEPDTWNSDEARDQLATVVLSAAPYLARAGRWAALGQDLVQLLLIDQRPATLQAALEYQRAVAEATGDPADLAMLAKNLASTHPLEAEPYLRRALALCQAAGNTGGAFTATLHLVDLLLTLGRAREAHGLCQQLYELGSAAGVGPWSMLASEVQRLRVLAASGDAVQALHFARRLRRRLSEMPTAPTAREVVNPFDARELLLSTGASAANDLREWGEALSFLDDLLASQQQREAPAHSIADTQFARYIPLKELGDFDLAETILLYCREVYEEAGDIDGLARTAGALGRVAWARGSTDQAISFQLETLKYAYADPRPHRIATAHRHLAAYLPQDLAQTQLAHGLIAAIVHRFTGNEQEGYATIAEIAERHHEPERLAIVTPQWLAATAMQIAGVDLDALQDRLGLDYETFGILLDEILDILHDENANAAMSRSALASRWEPAIATLVSAANGDESASEELRKHLAVRELAPEWAELAAVFSAILDGQRDPAVLLLPQLENTDYVIASRALDALAGRVKPRAVPAALAAVTEDAKGRHQRILDMVVAASRGDARARDALAAWKDAVRANPGGEDLAVAVQALVDGGSTFNVAAGQMNRAHARLLEAMVEAVAQAEPEPADDASQLFRELYQALCEPPGPSYRDVEVIISNGSGIQEALAAVKRGVDQRLAAGQTGVPVQLLELLVTVLLNRDDTRRALPLAERLAATLSVDHTVSAHPAVVTSIWVTAITAPIRITSDWVLTAAGPAIPRWTPAPLGKAQDPAEVDHARRWLAAARLLQHRIADREKEAVLASAEALFSYETGQITEAIERVRTALELFSGLSGSDVEISVAGAKQVLADAYVQQGDLAQALQLYDELFRTVPEDMEDSQLHKASLLIRRVKALWFRGSEYRALADLRQAQELLRQDLSPRSILTLGPIVSEMGDLQQQLGDLSSAVKSYLTGLSVARLHGHRKGEAAMLHKLGTIFGRLSTGDLATQSLAELVNIVSALPEIDFELGQVPLRDGARNAAIILLRRAADRSLSANDESGWAAATGDLAILATDDHEAINLLAKVLPVKQEAGDRLGQARTLANLGYRYRNVDQLEAAENAYKRSLEISVPAGYQESVASTLDSLGNLKRQQGDLPAAEEYYKQAVAIIEHRRPMRALGDQPRISYMHGREGVYVNLAECLLARGADNDAFNVIQQAKSRALLELVATGDLEPTHPPEERFAQLLAREAKFLAAIRMGHYQEVDGEYPLEALNSIYDEMINYDPEYVSMRRGTPANAESVRAWLTAQKRPILLAEYFKTSAGLVIFLLRAGWETVRVHVSNATDAELHRVFEDFRRQVVQYRNNAGAGWEAASRFLTEPLAPYLQPGDLVILVPHRTLHSFPIHALPLGGQPLVAQHPVAYAPSCGLLPLLQSPAKGTGRLSECAAFGVTYEAEAEAVAGVFGSAPMPPSSLSAESLAQAAAGADVIHLSCHAYFSHFDPLDSGVYLRSGDMPDYPDPSDMLTARQVMQLHVPSEMVTISACDTGAHRALAGDELVGLTRAFFYAGAPSIVASLWPVDADATRDFMVRFYSILQETYKRSGVIDKAEALRQAQLEVMGGNPRMSYYWAPFILIGDWR